MGSTSALRAVVDAVFGLGCFMAFFLVKDEKVHTMYPEPKVQIFFKFHMQIKRE